MSDDQPDKTEKDKARWVRPVLKPVGNVSQVLQGGGGKLSVTAQDSGDIRKPSGQG